MIRFARDFRLIPVVLLATICLFALKVSGLVFDGGYTLAERLQGRQQDRHAGHHARERAGLSEDRRRRQAKRRPPASAAPASKQPWAQEMFNYGGDNGDITGSVERRRRNRTARRSRRSTKPPDPPKLEVGDITVPIEPGKIASAGERAVLERLQDRRKELDTRSRELEMRESLLKATEKRLDAKVADSRMWRRASTAAMGNRDKAEAERFKSIVAMYENMKSKDAARILERLDMKILVEVATEIKPRKMSEILAQMTPEAAERLTVELARRADGKSQNAGPIAEDRRQAERVERDLRGASAPSKTSRLTRR